MPPAKPKCLLFLLGTNHFIKHSGVFFRSSRLEVFCEKRCSWKFTKLIGKPLRQGLFFNKVAFHRTPLVDAFDSYRGSCFITTREMRTWFDFSGYGHFTSGDRFWINFSTGDDVIGNIFPEVGIPLRHWWYNHSFCWPHTWQVQDSAIHPEGEKPKVQRSGPAWNC